MAAKLMDNLRRLAHQGITVVCSTHTMDTVHFFDTLIVLGLKERVGRLVFTGAPAMLLQTFAVHNAADLFDRLQEADAVALPRSMPQPAAIANQTTHTTGGVGLGPRRPRPEGSTLLRQAGVVAQRSLLGFWRDRANLALALLQPLLLALLVVFSQHAQSRSTFVHFFLVISAMWLGMTVTVRELVRERELYVRDRLACLAPDAYLGGKFAYAVVVVAAQALLLCLAGRLMVALFMGSSQSLAGDSLLRTPLLLGVWVLFLAGLGGAIIGLGISTLVPSERAAIAVLPLALLPQMLLSRVAFGDGGEAWLTASAFGPVAELGRYFASADATLLKGLLAAVSLPLLSRPATAVLDLPAHGVGGNLLAAEWAYLLVVVLGSALVLYLLFRWRERSWQGLR